MRSPPMAPLRQYCAVRRRRLRNRMPPLTPAIQASTTMQTMAVWRPATPTPPTTDTGPIMGTGPVSGLTPAAGVAGSATASLTALARDERFALVTPSLITALVTASPMPPGSAADSRLAGEESD